LASPVSGVGWGGFHPRSSNGGPVGVGGVAFSSRGTGHPSAARRCAFGVMPERAFAVVDLSMSLLDCSLVVLLVAAEVPRRPVYPPLAAVATCSCGFLLVIVRRRRERRDDL
jgi:hypothetical protein